MADDWWTDEMSLPKARTICMESRRPTDELREALNYLAVNGETNLIDGTIVRMAVDELERRGFEGADAYGEVLWARMVDAINRASLD